MSGIKLRSQERGIVSHDGVSLPSDGRFSRESLLSPQHNPDGVVEGRRGITVAMKWYINELKAAYESPLDGRQQKVLPMYDGTMKSRIDIYKKVFDRFLPLVNRLVDIDLDNMVNLLKKIHYELLTESIRLNPPTRNIDDYDLNTLKDEILIFGSFINHLRNHLKVPNEIIFKILDFSDWMYSIKDIPSNDIEEERSKMRRMVGGKSKKKKSKKKKRTRKNKKSSKTSTKKNKKKKRSKHK
jgi:hypothetical protein